MGGKAMAIGLKICPSCGLEPNDDVTSGCEDPVGCGKVKSYKKIGLGHVDYERIKYYKEHNIPTCDSIDHNEPNGCSNPECWKNLERIDLITKGE